MVLLQLLHSVLQRKELRSSHRDCRSSFKCAFVLTTVETWPSKACARCSVASARCLTTYACGRAAASRVQKHQFAPAI